MVNPGREEVATTENSFRKVLEFVDENNGVKIKDFEKKYDSKILDKTWNNDLVHVSSEEVTLTSKGKNKIGSWEDILAKLMESNTTKMEVMHHIAEKLIDKHNFKTTRDNRNLWVFTNPVYESTGEQKIEEEMWSNIPQHIRTQDVNQVKEQIKGKTQIPRPKVAKKQHLIPVKNGWYNLEKDKLESPNPDTFITNHIPVKYDPEADCPKIKEFINDIVKEESIPVIQEMFGFCLYRNYPIAKALMLLGPGKNGKSTLLNLLTKFIGEKNMVSPSLQKLIRNEHAKARLYGKLANIHGDLSDKKLKHSGNFKMLTGQDMVEGRHLYQEGFEFKNYAKLVYSANELPETKDTTDAFFRRWIIVEFPYKFTENPNDGYKNKDPDILDKITTDEEMSGLFNWALEGLKRVLEKGRFSSSDHTEEIKEKWMSQTNPVQVFLEKYCEYDSTAQVPKDGFMNALNNFAERNGAETKKKATITKKLAKTVPSFDTTRPTIDGRRTNCYKGLFVTNKWKDNVRVVRGKYEKSSAAGKSVSDYSKSGNSQSADFVSTPDESDEGDRSKKQTILSQIPDDDKIKTSLLIDRIVMELDCDDKEAEKMLKKLQDTGDIVENPAGHYRKL